MQTPLEISSVVFKPILIRAVVALAFGLTTVLVAIFLLGAAVLFGAGALAWAYFGSEVLMAVAVEGWRRRSS